MDIEYFNKRVRREGLQTLKEEYTPEVLKRSGLVSYWGAEFEFPTCPAFIRGVTKFAQNGLFAYTKQNGVYDSRVCWWMENMRAWRIEKEWILPTHGTIYALATAIRVFCAPSESIIVLTPTYKRYAMIAHRQGVDVTEVPLTYLRDEGRYEIDFDALEEAMAEEKNRLLVLCNPNNPTGTVFARAELERIAALSERYGVGVFSDEIFGEIVPEGSAVTPYSGAAMGDPYAITCTSLGKCMSLTGVNHSNVIIPNAGLREKYNARRLADHYGSIDPMLHAGLCEAYSEEGADFVKTLCKVIYSNARVMKEGVERALPGARVNMPEGSYVIWADYTGLGLDDEALRRLLEDEALFYGDSGGDYFTTGQYYRYNLAVPPYELERSMDYLYAHCAKSINKAYKIAGGMKQ